MRTSELTRQTKETHISVILNLDGRGDSQINSGSGFFDHMLELFAHHGRFDLSVECIGDTAVDFHHSIEDIGIVLGQAFREALGDKAGICRYADINLPMDEALVQVAVDLSGRAYLGFGLNIPTEKVGEFDCELVAEFFTAFTRELRAAVHLRQLAGDNSHHIIEAAFKATAHALRRACAIDSDLEGQIPSSKGVL